MHSCVLTSGGHSQQMRARTEDKRVNSAGEVETD